jgi:RNA polymerase sigma factor (sigma-70 family)
MTEQILVEQAIHLPRREAARWRHVRLDQEDLVGDGNLALVKAARKYDPTVGVPFPAFALHYVRGAILDAIRRRARRTTLGDGTLAHTVSFHDPTAETVTGDCRSTRPIRA